MREDVGGRVGMEGIKTLRMRDINGKYGTSVLLDMEDDRMEARGFSFCLLSRKLGYPDPRPPTELALRRGGGTLARHRSGE